MKFAPWLIPALSAERVPPCNFASRQIVDYLSHSHVVRMDAARVVLDVQLQTQEWLDRNRLHLNRHFSETGPRRIQQVIQHPRHRGALAIQSLLQAENSLVRNLQSRQGIGGCPDRSERIAQLVRQDCNEFVLLPILLFQRLFGLLELLPFVQIAQRGELFERSLAHLAPIGFCIFEQQLAELLLATKQRQHVVLALDLRMQHRPIARGADESEATAEEFEAPNSDRANDCASGTFGARGIGQKRDNQTNSRSLKTGRHRVVQIARFREPSEVLNQLGCSLR